MTWWNSVAHCRSLALSALSGSLLPGLLLAQGFQQGPPPKNLQVLPKDLTRSEVVARMRGIATALGVRCEYCHVSTTGPDGREQNDFAADDKETKKIARGMLRMVNDINDKYLIGDMGRTLPDRHRVSCVTCHHGLAKPRTIQAELVDALVAKNVDSAVALYRDLRTRYYGKAAYDFGELTIPFVAPEVAQMPNQGAAAIQLLKLNLEFYPQSVPTLTGLAQIYLQASDTAAALDALNRAAALAPDDRQVKGMLARVKGTPPQ
jgi:hypothetical protein